MNPFISIDKHLDEEQLRHNIEETAEAHGVSFQVAERYLALQKFDPDNLWGDADRYLAMHKERL